MKSIRCFLPDTLFDLRVYRQDIGVARHDAIGGQNLSRRLERRNVETAVFSA